MFSLVVKDILAELCVMTFMLTEKLNLGICNGTKVCSVILKLSDREDEKLEHTPGLQQCI